MIKSILLILLIVLVTCRVLKDNPPCARCGFSKEAHKNKDCQWHPDLSPCIHYVERI